MARKIIMTADGSPSVLDERTGASYHSRYGAIRESKHIFIEHGLMYALRTFPGEVNILEAGWGTGLNSLLTLRELRSHDRRVHYMAIEKLPLEAAIVDVLASHYPSNSAEKKIFKELHKSEWNKPHEIQPGFVFEKHLTDFTQFHISMPLHLIYYDAFAPANCPELWSPTIFEKLFMNMLPGAALVTFCASGAVKRMLKSSGFTLKNLPGPPGKWEMSRAIKPILE